MFRLNFSRLSMFYNKTYPILVDHLINFVKVQWAYLVTKVLMPLYRM